MSSLRTANTRCPHYVRPTPDVLTTYYVRPTPDVLTTYYVRPTPDVLTTYYVRPTPDVLTTYGQHQMSSPRTANTRCPHHVRPTPDVLTTYGERSLSACGIPSEMSAWHFGVLNRWGSVHFDPEHYNCDCINNNDNTAVAATSAATTTNRVRCCCCWLPTVPTTCLCISDTDLLRQLSAMPH